MERNKREAKCSKCGEVQGIGQAIKQGGKYYCEVCLPKPRDTRPQCDVCKLHFDKEELVSHTSRGKTKMYCPKCKSVLHTEERALYDLGEYIYEKHDYRGKQIPYEYIVGQLKVLKNMYPHYRYAGMLASLRYYYDVLGNDIHPNPYKLIPYIYEEAKAFYEQKRAILEHHKELEKIEAEERKPVYVKGEAPQPKLRAQIIDLDSLWEDK